MVLMILMYVLFATLVILSCIFRNSRVLSFVILLFMWIAYGWSSGNADFSVYQDAFCGIDNGSLSIGFRYLFLVFSEMGLHYRGFLIGYSFILLEVLYLALDNLTDNIAFALGMYLFFPFALDVVQIKNFAVVVFLTFAVSFLFGKKEREDGKENRVQKLLPAFLFTVGIILATLLHYSAIIYLILLVPYFLDRKKTIILSAAMIFTLLILKNTNLFALLSSIILPDDWVSSRMNQGTDVSGGIVFTRFLRVFLIAAAAVYNSFVLLRYEKNDPERALNGEQTRVIDFVGKANILLLISFPLMLYSQELYRIQQNFLIVNYVSLAFILEKKVKVARYHKIIIFALNAAISVFLLHQLVLGGNTQTVFRPFFERNVLFGGRL